MKELPSKFSPAMVEMGTCLVGVGVKRVGWVPVSGETYYCLRWVARAFRVRDGGEVSPEQWAKMDALQKHVFELRKAAR